MCFHIRPQHGVHARLVTFALRFEPLEHIAVDAQRYGVFRFGYHNLGISPKCRISRLGVGVRYRCRVNFGFGRCGIAIALLIQSVDRFACFSGGY